MTEKLKSFDQFKKSLWKIAYINETSFENNKGTIIRIIHLSSNPLSKKLKYRALLYTDEKSPIRTYEGYFLNKQEAIDWSLTEYYKIWSEKWKK